MFPLRGVRAHSLSEEASRRRGVLAVCIIAALGVLAGCGTTARQAAAPPAIGVALSPSTAQGIDQGQTKSVTATVSNDSSNKGVNWSVTCSAMDCGSVSPTSTASGAPTTYMAPGAVSAPLAVTVKATSVADTSKSMSVMITVNATPAVTMPAGCTTPPCALPPATPNAFYSVSLPMVLNLSGGTAPFTWMVVGSLPAGLTLNASTGVISGTPMIAKPSGFSAGQVTQGTTSSFTCTVTDSGSPAITVPNPPLMLSITVQIGVTLSPNSPQTLVEGQTLQITATVTNDPQSGGVSWMATCSAADCGSFNPTATASGTPTTYTAPTPVTANLTVIVTATSVTDNTRSASLTVTVTPPSNNAKLLGDFAVSFRGFDPNGEVAVAGRFHANGMGGLSNGVLDFNLPTASGGTFTMVPFTGTYTVFADNRGTLTANLGNGGIFTARFVLDSSGNGRIIEFDDTGLPAAPMTVGSGEIHKQDLAAASLSVFNGDFALGFIGDFNSGAVPLGRLGVVGRFTSDTMGAFSAGHVDFTVAAGPVSCQASLTGQLAGPDPTTGRGTGTATATPIILLCPGGTPTITFTFAYYVVGPNQAFVIDTDQRSPTAPLLSGVVHRQSATLSTAGSAVFAVTGLRGTGTCCARVAIGQFTTSTDGMTITSGLLDRNDGGNVTTNAPINGATMGTIMPDATVAGRFIISLTANFPPFFSPATLYLSDNLKGFILDRSGEVVFGLLGPQSVTTAGFNDASLAGTYGLGTVEPAASLVRNITGVVTLTSAPTPPSSLSGTVDISQSTSPFLSPDMPFSGTYTVATDSTVGRFTASATLLNPAGVPLSFAAYAVAPGQFVAIEIEVNSSFMGNPTSAIISFEQ